MPEPICNVKITGLGGMGILRASDILAEAVFLAGYDVKKSEVHGMSQRGGAIDSDVRFGTRVRSPMIPFGEADFLVVLAPDQLEVYQGVLRPEGIQMTPAHFSADRLPVRKALNVGMLGLLSCRLEVPEACWVEALQQHFPAKLHDANAHAFALGREAGAGAQTTT